LQADHIIEKQRLKRYGLAPTIDDARNGWLLCERHHGLKAHLGIRLSELPESVFSFARDFGIEWSLQRDYEDLPPSHTGSAVPW
jgi:hypothetical protein